MSEMTLEERVDELEQVVSEIVRVMVQSAAGEVETVLALKMIVERLKQLEQPTMVIGRN